MDEAEWRNVFAALEAPLPGMKRASACSAARGAQLAPRNIQVNAITQNFVDNPTYPPKGRPTPASRNA